MALSDYDIYKTDAGLLVGTDTITPIEGSSSLLLTNNGLVSADYQSLLVRKEDSFYTRGLTGGLFRTLSRINTAASAGYGVTFLQSQVDVTTAGALYGVFLARSRITIEEIVLKRWNSGGLQGSETVIFQQTHVPDPFSNVLALEVMWLADSTQFDGTYIRIQISDKTVDATNFSGLTTVYEDVDRSASRLSSSVAEGIAYHHGFGTGGSNSFTLDTTSFDEVVIS
jgi:hypothetical protein